VTRSCVIVSPYFPPSTLAGVHRARHLAKHLPAAGWTPTILCVDEAHHEQRLDPGLAALVPASVEVVKVGAYPARLTRLAGVGEIGLRAYPHLAAGVRNVLRRQRTDVVMITGSPYYPMLLAAMVKREFGLPVVLDFQDPWVSAAGGAKPLFSKSGASHALARWLEPIALRHADFVTSVSERQNEELAARHPWLSADRMAAMPIGGDPEDYAFLRKAGCDHRREHAEGMINLTYVGTIWESALGVVRELLAAIGELRSSHPDLAKRLRFNFIGTSARADGHQLFQVAPLAEAAGVGQMVRESPGRVPYLDALTQMANADVLLLIGSDEPHYTASKIYPALLSGRPSVGIFHRASSAFDILSRSGGARVVGFEGVEDLSSRRCETAQAIAEAALRPEALGKVDLSVLEPYEARSIARRFAAVFDAVAARERSQ